MNLYLLDKGTLSYDKELRYITDSKKILPVNSINNLYIYNEIVLDTKTISYLLKSRINSYIFDKYGRLEGSIIVPYNTEGINILSQARSYDSAKRIVISKQILKSAFNNMMMVLKYYNLDCSNTIFESINTINKCIDNVTTLSHLLILEAITRKKYYSYFNKIITNQDFKLTKRSFHPTTDYINALISFGNSIVYKESLEKIIDTSLNPAISYLHSTNKRKSGLHYDISEIYKPIIVDRVIFKLINKKMITKDDFITNEDGVIIKTNAKILFITEINKKLNTTIDYENHRISYKSLLKKDLVRLKKYIIKDKELEFFRSKW